MYPFIDTHCHLDMTMEKAQFSTLSQLLEHAQKHGPLPQAMVHVACHPDAFAQGVSLAEENPAIRLAFGVHPHDGSVWSPQVRDILLQYMQHPAAIAWGEMGLDYHYMHSPREAQLASFAEQLDLAIADGRPIVLHTREADEDTLQVLRMRQGKIKKMHVHCYTGNIYFAEQLLQCGQDVCFGFTGVVTFKNAEEIRNVVRFLDASRILIETDSPFLAPIPYRGQTAHPGMALQVGKAIAHCRGEEESAFFAQCRENTKRIYTI